MGAEPPIESEGSPPPPLTGDRTHAGSCFLRLRVWGGAWAGSTRRDGAASGRLQGKGVVCGPLRKNLNSEAMGNERPMLYLSPSAVSALGSRECDPRDSVAEQCRRDRCGPNGPNGDIGRDRIVTFL